jgi:hypothetical protein
LRAAIAAWPTSESSIASFPARVPGDEPEMTPEPQVQEDTLEPPSPAERRAFHLLPLAWVGVFVLAWIILYAVFR